MTWGPIYSSRAQPSRCRRRLLHRRRELSSPGERARRVPEEEYDDGGGEALQGARDGAQAVRGAPRPGLPLGDGHQQSGRRHLRGDQVLQHLRLQVFGFHQRHHSCVLRGLRLALILQVPRSLRLADFPPGPGGRVPPGDVVLGGGGGGVPGAGGRPRGVVGRGVLLLRSVLRQGHRVRGPARRRAALLRRALPRLRLQGVQQVRRPRHRHRRWLQASRGAGEVLVNETMCMSLNSFWTSDERFLLMEMCSSFSFLLVWCEINYRKWVSQEQLQDPKQ